ncbi:MAG TPA: endonuclease [bacterium]|nr:endonuclease [bacterium]HPN30698.1 endonuclease [bacterium]
MINRIFEKIENYYGWLGWWPSTPLGKSSPEYHKSKKYKYSKSEKFEIAVGAVLTQNAAWINVVKALENLKKLRIDSPEKILKTDKEKIIAAIRPSGYYNQKYKKIIFLSEFFIANSIEKLEKLEPLFLRNKFLEIWGVGKETADSIISYVFNKPVFVVDAYTRRVFKRNGIISGKEDYDEIRVLIENIIPLNILKYKNYHAVIVELCKQFCKTKPDCGNCVISNICGKNI